MNSGRFTAEEDRLLKKMAREKRTRREAAIILERGYMSVMQRIQILNLDFPRAARNVPHSDRLTPEILAWLRSRQSQGWTLNNILRVLGMTQLQLSQALNGHGLKMKFNRQEKNNCTHTPCMIPTNQIRRCWEKHCYLKEKCPVWAGTPEPGLKFRTANQY